MLLACQEIKQIGKPYSKKQNLEWSLRNISPLLLSLLKKATHDDFQIIAMYGETYFNLEFVEMTMIVKIFPNNPITRNVNRSKAENIIPVWSKGRI